MGFSLPCHKPRKAERREAYSKKTDFVTVGCIDLLLQTVIGSVGKKPLTVCSIQGALLGCFDQAQFITTVPLPTTEALLFKERAYYHAVLSPTHMAYSKAYKVIRPIRP